MKELFCFAIIPFVVGVVYAVLISLLIMRDKKSCEKKKMRKKVSKPQNIKSFFSKIDRKRKHKVGKKKREMYHS